MAVRVLHYVPAFGFGGIESLLCNINKYIDKDKLAFDFLVEEDGKNEILSDFEAGGSRLFRLPRLNWAHIGDYAQKVDAILRENRESIDIVHSHSEYKGYFVLEAAQKLGINTRIYHIHTSREMNTKYRLASYVLRKLQIMCATDLFACSKKAARFGFGVKRTENEDFVFFRNAIESQNFAYNARKRAEIRQAHKLDDKLVIGHVGRFSPPKNQLFLLDIFKQVHAQYGESLLMLIGDGSLKPALEERVNELGLNDSVWFMGQRGDVNELMQAMDAFLLPSLYEGFPVTCIEAQCAGLQCFLSDNITSDAKITDMTHFIGLKEPASYWAKKILEHSLDYERADKSADIAKAGFDARTQAMWLQNFYLSKIRGPF